MNKSKQKNELELLEASFSLSNQAIYIINLKGKILHANENALNTLDYNFKELTQLNIWDIDILINTKEKYLSKLNSFTDKNTIQSKHKKSNGEIFPVEMVIKPLKIEDEEYLICYTRDITNRLRRTEEINFYFDLINSSKDMIFVIEFESTRIEFANETACQILGFSLEELKSKKISELRKPIEYFDNISLPEVLRKIHEMDNLTTFGKFIAKDKKEIPVESSLRFKEYKGRKFITAISRDISDRLEIEIEKEKLSKKLKNYNKTLEKEISKAKNDLIEYESIMKRQSRMAAMGEMLENIAHQWRQPLSAVSVLSTGMILQNEQNLLNKELLDAGLNDINEQIQYLSKTIDDFRNFFKPNKQKTKFSLSSLIKTSIKLSKARYTKKHIEFILDLKDLELYTYENELLQVLLNLITNAKDELIKKEYKKFIFLETYVDNYYFYIKVKDNAGGIDEMIVDRIFEPYFTTKHNSQGTGIGLYMSENIIKHMQGKISVKNVNIEYNNNSHLGVCFEIKLPLIHNK